MASDNKPPIFLVVIFPDSSEYSWVEELPRAGSQLRSRYGRSWTVHEVLQSGRRTYTVHCGEPSHGLGASRDLASDLLTRAARLWRRHEAEVRRT